LKAECVHFWEVEPPSGTDSLGVCRLCGEERRFPNVDKGNGRPSSWRQTRKALDVLEVKVKA